MPPAQVIRDKPEINPWLIAVAVMLATFMEVLDTSIAALALPYIAGSLSASNDEATWVLTSYLVANAIVLPASSWFSLRFGRKRFLLFCIVLFTVSSFACGAATSLGMILRARPPGCGRWRTAAAFPSDSARNLPATEACHGNGRICIGRCSGPGPWADTRRMAHRHLLVAMGFLHQYS